MRSGIHSSSRGGRLSATSFKLRKTALSIWCRPNRTGMMPGRTDLVVLLDPRDMRLSSSPPPPDRIGDARLDATVTLVERCRIGPAQFLVDERARGQPEQEWPKMLGIAANQGTGQGDDLPTASGQGAGRVALCSIRAFLFVDLVENEVLEEA